MAYAKRICEIAGDDSPTCITMRSAVRIMSPKACVAGMNDIAYSEQRIVKGQGVCNELANRICEAVGVGSKACGKVTQDTKRFPPQKCTAMLEHLPEVIAEVKEMQLASHEPLSPELQTAIAEGSQLSFGPANSKVHVIEFSDFECAACARMARVVRKAQQQYQDRVRFTYRAFPLKKNPNSRLAAQAALAANKQGKFWEFYDRLFESSKFDRPALEQHAQSVGLDLPAFKKSLDSKEFAAAVEADVKLGERVPVERTPSVFINGVRIDYASDFEAVVEKIETALRSSAPG
jgi:protein-disulfide isomerase